MIRNRIIILLGILVIFVLFFFTRQSQQENQMPQQPEVSAISDVRLVQETTSAVKHPSAFQRLQSRLPTTSRDDRTVEVSEGVQRARQELLREDIEKMKVVCKLSDEQLASVSKKLQQIRLDNEPLVRGSETVALREILTPEQFEAWSKFIDQETMEGAEHFASIKARLVSRAIADMTLEQKDALLNAFVNVVIKEHREDEEVLKEVLTDAQFARWQNSDLAAVQELSE